MSTSTKTLSPSRTPVMSSPCSASLSARFTAVALSDSMSVRLAQYSLRVMSSEKPSGSHFLLKRGNSFRVIWDARSRMLDMLSCTMADSDVPLSISSASMCGISWLIRLMISLSGSPSSRPRAMMPRTSSGNSISGATMACCSLGSLRNWRSIFTKESKALPRCAFLRASVSDTNCRITRFSGRFLNGAPTTGTCPSASAAFVNASKTGAVNFVGRMGMPANAISARCPSRACWPRVWSRSCLLSRFRNSLMNLLARARRSALGRSPGSLAAICSAFRTKAALRSRAVFWPALVRPPTFTNGSRSDGSSRSTISPSASRELTLPRTGRSTSMPLGTPASTSTSENVLRTLSSGSHENPDEKASHGLVNLSCRSGPGPR